jgi:hypothetical protein
MKTLLAFAVSLIALTVIAQPGAKKSVVIGSMTSRPNALLIVNPQGSDQGVLLPQLSTGQRASLKPTSPDENGLIVFDTNQKSYFYWSDGAWVKLHAENNLKESYFSIDPAHFRQLNPNDNIRHGNLAIFESDNTFITASRNGFGEEIIAPVTVPHGAVLKEVSVFYMDNDADNLKVYFVRKSHTGASEQIIAWESVGTSASVRTESFGSFNGKETIDLQNYTYRVVVAFDLDDGEDVYTPLDARQRIYGIRIKYQP